MTEDKYDSKMTKISNNNRTSLDEMCPLQNGSKENNDSPCEQIALTASPDHYDGHNNHISQNNLSNYDSTSHSDSDDDESETRCGWGPCSPKWLKMFASKQVMECIFKYFQTLISLINSRFSWPFFVWLGSCKGCITPILLVQ